MNSQTYPIQGMTCGSCGKHVEKALRSVDGVSSVVVDVPHGTATVEGDATFEALAAKVAAAGYGMTQPV